MVNEDDAEEVETTAFEVLGSDEGIAHLVDRFYDLMDTEPHCRDIRVMHPADLTESRHKLVLFLTGWLGGPPRYVERYGHPRLRARHLPFSIGDAERDQWMWCMQTALNESVPEGSFRDALLNAFQAMASHMRNQR